MKIMKNNSTIAIDGIIFSLQKFGGISVYVNELLRVLHSNRESYQLFIEEPAFPYQVTSPLNNNLVVSRRARLFERYRPCRLSVAPTVFHSSYYRTPSIKNVTTLMTVYDFIYERHVGGIRRMVHSIQKYAAIRSAQSVICISEATRKDLLHFVGEVPGQAVHVIHCGVSEVFRPISCAADSKPYVLFVGQRGGYKNFKLAVAAMEHLQDLEMVCVGGGALRPDELEGLSVSTRERIVHAGHVDDEGLNLLYNGATCLLYPSSHEGFGIPVIEAMRAGCPVVSLTCEAVMEVGGDALTVVHEHDSRAVADGVNATRSSSRAELISRGFAISSRYSWDETHRQTLQVYSSLM